MLSSHTRSLFFGGVALLALGSVVFAAGPGEPLRGLPYQGVLEQDGNPVSAVGVSMEFILYDGQEATGEVELWRDTYSVNVASGSFNTILGDGGVALPDSVFAARELWLAVVVEGTPLPGRKQVWALAQATRSVESDRADLAIAAESAAGGNFEVANGRIWRGADPGGTNDLGLYSGVPNNFMRFVTTNSQSVFYNDGGNGTTADVLISGNRMTVNTPMTVNQNVTGLTATLTNCSEVLDACEIDGGFLRFLDRMNDLTCPANKVLNDWNVRNCGNNTYQMRFSCCNIVVQ